MIIVVAGNYKQFDQWLRHNVIYVNENDPEAISCIERFSSIVALIGTYQERRDLNTIKEIALIRGWEVKDVDRIRHPFAFRTNPPPKTQAP